MKFTEDSRVKIPTILHLMRLGYDYLSLKTPGLTWDPNTNIFTDIFKESIQRLNPAITPIELENLYGELSLSLENEDLGRAFYHKLIDNTQYRLIDFNNFDQNKFHVVTELTYKKDDEEFRPDITLLINGMPLVFIEVKKPNNKDGVLIERTRMKTRAKNKKFRKFMNITQMMIFSNNMEYDDASPLPITGAFYASTSYDQPNFNYFREEEKFDLENILSPLSAAQETEILKDNNLIAIQTAKEFITNKNPNSPTNRLCTSLLQRQRLAFMLEYGLTYVEKEDGLQKHIMRYPQIFATKAIEKRIADGQKKGIIWHTQGSGKTALAAYNIKALSHYFQTQNTIAKFYFIVDRLDLLIQASKEFIARGLVVHKIETRADFAKDIKEATAIHNSTGRPEITVVNIQKFQDDPTILTNTDYNLNIQRVFFLDEVHRSYNPKGSFLANLQQTDRHSIKIGLTGTPLLGSEYDSKSIFGNYIHKYYYNASIKDGYTLKLIREEIETQYRMSLQKSLEGLEMLKGGFRKQDLYAHPQFVEPMLDYIIKDFETSRFLLNQYDIGGMVICDSSEQAKIMYEIFQHKYAAPPTEEEEISQTKKSYTTAQRQESKVKTAALILHDVGTKKEREDITENFKDGKIDFLFVHQMLLTGFDSARLKKLYLGRVIKAHNLLQALTRVNRPYHHMEYGYVVDFANIEKEFEKTNRDYYNELQSELGDEIEHYTDMFKSQEEINAEIDDIKNILLFYEIDNAEEFSQQISQINDHGEMLKITKALDNAKALYNLIRLSGDRDLLDKLDFDQLSPLSREAHNRLALINQTLSLKNNAEHTNLLNLALEDIVFAFHKVKEEEMIIADQLKESLRKTREMLAQNFDIKDPEFTSLKQELERLFKKKNMAEVSKEEMTANIAQLDAIYKAAKELERKNLLLKKKYNHDEKYVRVYKRLLAPLQLEQNPQKLVTALQNLKRIMDGYIEQNSHILDNEGIIKRMMQKFILDIFKKEQQIPLDLQMAKEINQLVVSEYLNEYNGVSEFS